MEFGQRLFASHEQPGCCIVERETMTNGLTSLEGCLVLIAEDEPMIAMMLEDVVEQLGGVVAGVASSCSQALGIIADQSVQLVVLDVHLDGSTSDAVLIAAEAKGIPVLVSSGSDSRALPESFKGRPMLSKPWTMEEAERALRSILDAP